MRGSLRPAAAGFASVTVSTDQAPQPSSAEGLQSHPLPDTPGGKKKKKKRDKPERITSENREQVAAELRALSPEEYNALYSAVQRAVDSSVELPESFLERVRDIQERNTGFKPFEHVRTLADMKEAVRLAQLRLKRGAGRPTFGVNYEEERKLLDPVALRPGAEKMELSPQQVAERCSLTLVGEGCFTTPMPVLGALHGAFATRDGGWAMYAWPEKAQKALAKGYGGKGVDEVALGQGIYSDAIAAASKMELTVAMMASRDLPLAEAQDRYGGRLRAALERLGPTEADRADCEKLVGMFDPRRVELLSWVDGKKAAMKRDTMVWLSPVGKAMVVEATSPGRLVDKKTTRLGEIKSAKVQRAVYEVLLGPEPADPVGKLAVGYGLCQAAHGELIRPADLVKKKEAKKKEKKAKKEKKEKESTEGAKADAGSKAAP
ncbi:unnamed protein product [Pedinophyceae sp. YPF-701]|nr:unnamed protein product [Pedinophyceae sp. YPF-701]